MSNYSPTAAVAQLRSTSPYALPKPTGYDALMSAMRDGIDFIMRCTFEHREPRIIELKNHLLSRHDEDVVAKAIRQMARMGR